MRPGEGGCRVWWLGGRTPLISSVLGLSFFFCLSRFKKAQCGSGSLPQPLQRQPWRPTLGVELRSVCLSISFSVILPVCLMQEFPLASCKT